MTGYTCNLDSFGLSSHGLEFNSMAVVDGVLVGLDAAGAFVLNGPDDDGADFEAYIETGWTDGAGALAEGVPTNTRKRVRALYIDGIASEALDVTLYAEDDIAEESAEFFNRDAPLVEPAAARVIPPLGLSSVWWKFRIGSVGPGVWRVASLRAMLDMIARRV